MSPLLQSSISEEELKHLDQYFSSTFRLGVNYFEKVINYLQLHWKLFN